MSNALNAIRYRNATKNGNEIHTPHGDFALENGKITFYGAKGGFEILDGADEAAVMPFFI